MEIRITTRQVLKLLQILSWIIFIGLCIEAGAFLFNTIYTFAINPINTKSFWDGADLSSLYDYDKGYFLVITGTIIIVAVLKATMFYLIVKLFAGKDVDLARPFSEKIKNFTIALSCFAIGIAFFIQMGVKYATWLIKKGVKTIDLKPFHLEGADVWLFMAVIFFVLAQIIKRGIEIQTENELTV